MKTHYVALSLTWIYK